MDTTYRFYLAIHSRSLWIIPHPLAHYPRLVTLQPPAYTVRASRRARHRSYIPTRLDHHRTLTKAHRTSSLHLEQEHRHHFIRPFHASKQFALQALNPACSSLFAELREQRRGAPMAVTINVDESVGTGPLNRSFSHSCTSLISELQHLSLRRSSSMRLRDHGKR